MAHNFIEEEKSDHAEKTRKSQSSPENIVQNALFQFMTLLTTFDLSQPPNKQKLLKTLKYIPSIDYFQIKITRNLLKNFKHNDQIPV